MTAFDILIIGSIVAYTVVLLLAWRDRHGARALGVEEGMHRLGLVLSIFPSLTAIAFAIFMARSLEFEGFAAIVAGGCFVGVALYGLSVAVGWVIMGFRSRP